MGIVELLCVSFANSNHTLYIYIHTHTHTHHIIIGLFCHVWAQFVLISFKGLLLTDRTLYIY
jgi:hypothetical protein